MKWSGERKEERSVRIPETHNTIRHRAMRHRLYYFSPRSLDFKEAKWAKTRLVLGTIVFGAILFIALFELNQFFDDMLGMGFKRSEVLVAENVLMKSQLKMLANRLKSFEAKLTQLNERGNELRLMVDLPKIDEDVRAAGVGGTDERVDFGGSPDVNELLNILRQSVGKAERELELQQRSYRDVVETSERNSVKFAHMPAIKPMDGYLTSGFGMRRHPILGYVRMHEGIDISNETGTPVFASGDGVVRFAGRSGPGFGIMIEVDHGFGYSSLYGHLSKVRVREGQKVKRGELIGDCGRTGLATNANLHYEVRLNGVLQNPIDFFLDGINTHYIKDNFAAHD